MCRHTLPWSVSWRRSVIAILGWNTLFSQQHFAPWCTRFLVSKVDDLKQHIFIFSKITKSKPRWCWQGHTPPGSPGKNHRVTAPVSWGSSALPPNSLFVGVESCLFLFLFFFFFGCLGWFLGITRIIENDLTRIWTWSHSQSFFSQIQKHLHFSGIVSLYPPFVHYSWY